MSEMSNQELLRTFADAILERMNKFDDIALFLHLQDALKTSFERIKGAWSQYKDKEVDKKGLITSGIYVLGIEFVNAFLDESTKQQLISRPPKPVEVKPEVKSIPKEEPKLEEEAPPEKTYPNLDLSSLDLEIQIPSILFDEEETDENEGTTSFSTSAPEKPKFDEIRPKSMPTVMPLKPEVFSTAKPSVKPIPTAMPLKPEVFSPVKPTVKPISPPQIKPREEKIEHVAEPIITRSKTEALQTVDVALKKVKLEPLKFDKVGDKEIKSVNVGAQLPGNLIYDLFTEARELIYEKEYDKAVKKLEQVKENAEFNNDDEAFDRAVDMMANISAYKMISVLMDAGDKIIDQPGKAAKKFNKALGFAKTVKDEHFILKIKDRLSKIQQNVNLMLAKKDFEEQEEIRLKKLLKQNIIDLSKKETLMSIEDIVKYCNAKTEDVVIEAVVDLIKTGEVFAKYFVESGKVMFDKDANRDKIRLKIDF